MKNKKLLSTRNLINKKFQLNQKGVFWEWKNKKIDIKTTPSKETIEHFWSNIWNKPASYNENAKWIKTLKRKYCSNAVSKNYQINLKAFQQVLSNTKNSGTPGPNNISAYTIKRLPCTHIFIVDTCWYFWKCKTLSGWLVKGKTILLPKTM